MLKYKVYQLKKNSGNLYMKIHLGVKRLLLIKLIFIIVISCDFDSGDFIEVKSKDNIVVILKKDDFEITKNKKYINLKVTNVAKSDSIKNLIDCEIIFGKGKFLSKGINIKNSITPSDCDYFFSEDDKQHIIIRDKIITLKSINI